MDAITAKADETTEREAQARLSEMRTHEVSLVDVAANLRRYLSVKRGEMDPETSPAAKDNEQQHDDPPPADAPAPDGATAEKEETAKIALPGAAKQTIMDGLAAVLERLTGLAQVVGEASIDDGAAVPPDVVQMVSDASMMLSGLADQFAPAEGDAEPEQPPAEEETDETETEQAMDGAGGEQAPPPEADQAETEKAGRKISGARLAKLQQMAAALVDLVRDLGGGGDDEPTTKGNEPNPIAEQLAALAKSLDGLGERIAKVETSVQHKLEQSDEQGVALEKAQGALANLAASLRAPGESNAREPEGGNGGTAAVLWADDMADHVRRKLAKKG